MQFQHYFSNHTFLFTIFSGNSFTAMGKSLSSTIDSIVGGFVGSIVSSFVGNSKLLPCLLVIVFNAVLVNTVKADVPPECAALYQENGSVPQEQSCEFLAATVSVGLSNFWCRSVAFSEEYCDTPIVSDNWGDLAKLQANYQEEKQANSPDTGFAHQFLCITEKSCENFEAQGESGWAADFVKFLFEYMGPDGKFPGSLSYNCPDFMSKDVCFDYKGYGRHGGELVKGFYAYCGAKGTRIDYDRWDSDHNSFIDKGVRSCLLEVIDSGDLNGVWAPRITVPASDAREIIQVDCRVWNFVRSGYSVVGDGPIDFLALLKNSNDTGDVVVPENLRKPAPVREDFYHASWEDAGDLKVSVSDDIFFVKPGDQVAISASRLSADGTALVLDEAAGVEYQLLTNSDVAQISPSGVLSINRVVSPFSTATISNVILVAAFADGEYGIGQVMVIDDDTDGDTLVDSYEDSVGLNKLIATNVFDAADGSGAMIMDAALDYLAPSPDVIITAEVNKSTDTELELEDDPLNDTDDTLIVDPNPPVPSGSTTSSGGGSGGGSVSIMALMLLLLASVFRNGLFLKSWYFKRAG